MHVNHAPSNVTPTRWALGVPQIERSALRSNQRPLQPRADPARETWMSAAPTPHHTKLKPVAFHIYCERSTSGGAVMKAASGMLRRAGGSTLRMTIAHVGSKGRDAWRRLGECTA